MTQIAPVLLVTALLATPGFTQTAGSGSVGALPCAGEANALISSCQFEAVHHEDSKTTLRVLLPSGSVRYIYFVAGKATSTDSTRPLASSIVNGTIFVLIGEAERFEIPETVITGG